ncbi:MAG TPA: hypothetical protein VN851_02040, partial [Thermoanaerobaculia bacterium]|nr:hypothetical protein [Thermoanaerobaculia bacterium]
SFTVRATMAQSIAWKRAAEAEGFRSVGAWIAGAVDAYLRARARAGRPLPLAWRYGRFLVALESGEAAVVSGMASPPFGYFEGSAQGADRNHRRTLVHMPSGKIIATLRTAGQCRTLAAELAPAYARDEATAAGIVHRHQLESA